MKKVLKALTILLALALLLSSSSLAFAGSVPAPLQAQETCPTGPGWTKVEAPDPTISGTTISFSIPAGKVVTAVCVKASTNIYNWTGTATAHFAWNIGGQHDVSHYSYYIIDEQYEVCSETFTVYGDWSDWRELPNGDMIRHRIIKEIDARDQETVCSRRVELDRYTPEPEGDYYADVTCDGWAIYYKACCECQPQLVDEGTWKDLITDESFTAVGEGYEIRIIEPQDCEKPCVEETVFVWFNENGCNLRQRSGPIAGQTRPFLPMQFEYCCGVEPTDYGWTGRYISSCQKPEEYRYWNELPLFNGLGACR